MSLVYRLQNVLNVYNHSFGIVPNESLWPENIGDECCHDPKKLKKSPLSSKKQATYTPKWPCVKGVNRKDVVYV